MRRHIANIITGLRVVCSFLLLLFPVFSPGFYVTFLLCGLSDMTDGIVARKTHSTNGFGAKFDTIADLVFMMVACYKLLPAIHLPQWGWIWIGVIAVVKLSNIAWGALRRKTLISVHSILNKITGGALFLLPLTLHVVGIEYSLAAVCPIATLAALQEGHLIRTGREIV